MKKILLISIVLSGCSSNPVKLISPPTYERLELIKSSIIGKNELNESEGLAKEYLEAMALKEKGEIVSACKQFLELEKNKAFPLNQSALVHTLDICTYTISEIKNIWKKTNIDSFLKEAFLKNSLRQAEKLKIQESIAEFSYELVPFKQLQSEKVYLLQNAIKIAQKLKMKELEEKYFKRLTEVSPMNLREVLPDNIFIIAKDYESNRKFDKARSYYMQIVTGDFSLEEKIKAYDAYRISYKVERNLKAFLEKTTEMEIFLKELLEANLQNIKIQEAWVEAKITLARAIWTEHENAKAREVLEEILIRKIGSQNQLATLYWIYGSLHIESKELAEGLEKYERAASYKITILAMEENIQWAIVWNKFQLKKDKEVTSDIDRFVKKSNNPLFFNKLKFWKAKSLQRSGHDFEAGELFKAITLNDSFGYYGLVSALETNEILSPLEKSEIILEPLGNITLDWLLAVDEKIFATKVLKEINSQFKTIAQRERAMSLYAQTEWFQGGMVQLYNFPMRNREDLTKKYISVLFPTPNDKIVTIYSEKYKVPKAFIYAIIRQESSFNSNVRSWADAFGLMQLIPEKAEELSVKYHIPYKDFNELYDPKLNIELGTAFLAELRTKYNSKFIQSVASYNASNKAIEVWQRERFNGNYLEFIEMIPYEETRNYIKLVFRNYITYKRVMEPNGSLIPENFFEIPFN